MHITAKLRHSYTHLHTHTHTHTQTHYQRGKEKYSEIKTVASPLPYRGCFIEEMGTANYHKTTLKRNKLPIKGYLSEGEWKYLYPKLLQTFPGLLDHIG